MACGNIINKGICCKVNAKGSELKAGTNYTAVLYYSPKQEIYKITTTAIAETNKDDEVVCSFVFSSSDTEKLRVGNVILEIYDTSNKEQMFFDDNYAVVRATSITD